MPDLIIGNLALGLHLADPAQCRAAAAILEKHFQQAARIDQLFGSFSALVVVFGFVEASDGTTLIVCSYIHIA